MNVQASICRVLRIGMVLSISLIVLGIAITYARHPEFRSESLPLKTVSKVAPVFPYTLAETGIYMANVRGRGFVVAGILALICAPVAATMVSIIAYARQKDRPFLLISCGILIVLIVGFYIGHLHTP
ncbi:MAG: DUF1634 domain-containing protein [Phycisphaerales bacterium]|nr:DUF1634 domain-containing protein [Phycisphaerales bacterium]